MANYENSSHNEFNRAHFHGDVNFNWVDRFGDRAKLRKHKEIFESLASLAKKSTFLEILSHNNQEDHMSNVPLIDVDNPKLFWIFKNIDFKRWKSPEDRPPVLWLCGPSDCSITSVCSDLVKKEKQKATHVFYFFCSAAEGRGVATTLANSFLHYILSHSSHDQGESIANEYVSSLLHIILHRGSSVKQKDSPEKTIQSILDEASGNESLEALSATISRIKELQETSIIIDRLDEIGPDGARLLEKICEHLGNLNPKSNALLAYQLASGMESVAITSPCIEYDKERQDCLRSLHYDGDDARHDKILKEHSGSLEWLWNHEKYRGWWESEASSLLFIEGKPGSGKSTLAKYFNQKLGENESSSIVAHYFYTFRETKLETSHANMLRSILYSILKQDEQFFFHFQPEFRRIQPKNHQKWPYDSLEKILLSFEDHPVKKQLYIILDAMDESEEKDRRRIVNSLSGLCSKTRICCLKIFLTSRPISQIDAYQQEHYYVISLQEENKADIVKFVHDTLSRCPSRLSGEIIGQAKDNIIKRAEGVFIWVSLASNLLLDQIDKFLDENKIMPFLNSVPVELKEFYKFTLDRVPSEEIEDTRKIFRFVVFAQRPLTAIELYHATIFPEQESTADSIVIPSDERFDRNTNSDMINRILYLGRNMLETKGDGANKTIQVIHETVREFSLELKPDKANPDSAAAQIAIGDTADAHTIISSAITRYLKTCFRIQETYPKPEAWTSQDYENYVGYLGRWTFVNYALENLEKHIYASGSSRPFSRELTYNTYPYLWGGWMFCQPEEPNPVFVSSPHYFLQRPFLRLTGDNLNEPQTCPADLKYKLINTAAKIGPLPLTRALIITYTVEQTQGKTKMIAAAENGYFYTVKLLIDLGESIEAEDDLGQRALHHAVKNKHEDIVRLLVENKADRFAKDKKGRDALHLAALNCPYDLRGRRIYPYKVHRYLYGLRKSGDIVYGVNDGDVNDRYYYYLDLDLRYYRVRRDGDRLYVDRNVVLVDLVLVYLRLVNVVLLRRDYVDRNLRTYRDVDHMP